MSTITESTETETTYTVVFERIGQRRDVAPLVARVRDTAHLGEVIRRYARQFRSPRSHDVMVVVDVEHGWGLLAVGERCVGSFTLTEKPPTPVQLLRAAAEVAPHGPVREYYQRAADNHALNGGTCPAGGNCWFEQRALADLAAVSEVAAS